MKGGMGRGLGEWLRTRDGAMGRGPLRVFMINITWKTRAVALRCLGWLLP
jgi:hypothetical protein